MCRKCGKSFTWKRKFNKHCREYSWFKQWVGENFSVRQISEKSGHSPAKIKRIKNYWLGKSPEESFDYSHIRYLLFDGTYFHKLGCLLTVMSVVNGKIILTRYVDRERYENALEIFAELKHKGVSPVAITLDGHKAVLRAVKTVWPDIIIQRCLFHIQHEGMRWLRSNPKTQAGKDLRCLLDGLAKRDTAQKRDEFLDGYQAWLSKYADYVRGLPQEIVACKDLKKVMALINNAKSDMFHFIEDDKIQSTTNKLENFYSGLKSDYQRHRGLSELHKQSFLKWYCYIKNEKNSNTF